MADKIREAAFSSLDSFGIEPERVLDLYAGSGAVGIEALSRGAGWADFVDRDRIACQTMRENLRSTGLEERGRVHQATIEAFLERVDEPYDFVILDPPYADPAILDTLERLARSSAVAPGTAVLLGHWPRLDVPERIGPLELLRQRCHGDSCFAIFEVVGDD
jgi:16S rRNA (guanine966-N2)-methyltransferase